MKKYIITSAVAFLALASFTAAQSFTFSNNLSVGSSGSDVVALQTWLISNSYDIPAVSSGKAAKGYFGAQTKIAVAKYQAANGIPNTGFVGPLTRSRLNQKVIVDSRAPVINGIDAPTSLNVNEKGTWTVRALDPSNGSLSYSVDWGDVPTVYPAAMCPEGYSCSPVGTVPFSNQQSSTFTHAYSSTGTYTVRFTVKNSVGLTSQSSVTVRVGLDDSMGGPLKIISPNGGESWLKGTTQTIKWTAPNYVRATNADLKLVEYREPFVCPATFYCMPPAPVHTYPIAYGVSINQSSYSWNVGQYTPEVVIAIYPVPRYTVPDCQYTLQICESGTNNCDSSDAPFTISSVDRPSVNVISPNGGEVLSANSEHRIEWGIGGVLRGDSITNTKVDIYLDQTNIYCITAPCGSTYVLDKDISASTIYNWIVATDIVNDPIPAADYTMRICIAGSTTNCDTSDKYFTISPEASHKITVSLPNGGETYKIGSEKTISWEFEGQIRPEYYVALTWEPGYAPIAIIPATQTSYSLTIPDSICWGGDACGAFTPGSYRVKIALYDSKPCVGFCVPTGAKLLAEDESDRVFKVVAK